MEKSTIDKRVNFKLNPYNLRWVCGDGFNLTANKRRGYRKTVSESLAEEERNNVNVIAEGK